jgi:hypothetical protein
MAGVPGSSDIQKNTENLGEMVRSWVHFDNLAATFVRQAQQARTARARWEAMILDNLQKTKMSNAIIQIGGGRLSVSQEKHAQPLTYGRLEALLHEYHSNKPKGSDDETGKIMDYIKKHREYSIESRLKKS